jgi:hypothetical protein
MDHWEILFIMEFPMILTAVSEIALKISPSLFSLFPDALKKMLKKIPDTMYLRSFGRRYNLF